MLLHSIRFVAACCSITCENVHYSNIYFFIPQIRELRHLFNDDTMFVALQSNEKFPEEGFDVDVQSKSPFLCLAFL